MNVTPVRFLQSAIVQNGLLKIDNIGSGVGVIIYSPAQKTAAGLHILAPTAGGKTPKNPIMYADTAIPFIIEELGKKGVKSTLSVAIAGGAVMMGANGGGNTGDKVVAAVQGALKMAGLAIKMHKTGGSVVRSMVLDIDAGKIKIT